MPGKDIYEILAQLSTHRAENAWKAFLNIYIPTIMHVVHQYEGDKSRADECFLFVCEKLSDDGFQRLLRFDIERRVKFSSWLKLVVSHLCVDWHRKEYGRQRPYRAISKLPAIDQHLHHLNIECGMNRLESFEALKNLYPDLTEVQFAESMGRLHTSLTPKQRWQLSMRKRETGSAVVIDALGDHPTAIELVEKNPGPEKVCELCQTREKLVGAMAQLSRQQRLLLHLRYQQDLSLKDVADLAGLGDLHKAKRRIKGALTALSELLTPDKSVS